MLGSNTDEDWRLRAELPVGAAMPRGILAALRGPEFVPDAQDAAGAEVVFTHHGSVLFGYARDLGALRRARSSLEGIFARDGMAATVTISQWEDDVGDWAQVEPPLDPVTSAAHERTVRDAHAPTTQTFVVNVGREIRAEFEQSMLAWAQKLGVHCDLVEHAHLLHTQVAFTVSGSVHAVDEFRQGLRAEERATIRAEQVVMTSPL